MNDTQLLRYSRQIMLPSLGYDGQEKITKSKVLIIGLGGLGSPVALYLAAAGVGQLVLCDDDEVDLSNLQRQIIHKSSNIGESKTASAKETIQALNPEVQVSTISKRLTPKQLEQQMLQVDVVVDASDNFSTRFLINKVSVKTKTPLVSGAAIKMEGQVSVFNLTATSPCYHCLYKDTGEEMDNSCAENGILAPVVGMIGTIQALEALKIIADFGSVLDGRLQLLDALAMEWREMKLKKDPQCPICSSI